MPKNHPLDRPDPTAEVCPTVDVFIQHALLDSHSEARKRFMMTLNVQHLSAIELELKNLRIDPDVKKRVDNFIIAFQKKLGFVGDVIHRQND